MAESEIARDASAWTPARRGQYRHLILLWLLFLATSLVTRIVLASVSLQAGLITFIQLPYAFAAGLLLDALTGLYLCLPLAIWIWLMPARWYASRVGRLILRAGFAISVFGLLYLIAAEYFFFDEFNARFNYTAVEYLIYPTEVIGNIRDSYPVDTVLLLCALGALLITFLLRRRIARGFADPVRFARRSLVTTLLVIASAVSAWTVSLESVQSLQENRIAEEVAANGVYSFFSALRNARIDYARYYATLPEAEAIARVRKLLQQSNTRWLAAADAPGNPIARAVDNSDLGPPRPMHVIFLFEESMGAEFVGSLGGKGWTPNIDRIAAESLSFTHLYASGTRTVRGMEALTTSLAPVPPESVVKRTGNENLFNLSTIMRKQGYSPTFIYGGYGSFDDMNAYYQANGWRVIDRTDMPKPRFATVWGISDEELFENALVEFDQQVARGERIFSLVMSTSNHRPYLFPAGIPGVKAEGGGREAGVRYADHAIGRFFDQLQEKPWYKDTVLVIAGDHGARVYGRAQIPVSNYTIPFVVHAPSIIAPRRVDTLSSQVDIGPTVLGLLHLSYESWLPGRDILRMGVDDGYAIFNHNRNVAMMRGGELATLGFRKTINTERYDPSSDQLSPAGVNLDLERDTQALFQLSWEMFADGRQREK
ncbi:MAG: sulfatase-like hydrolase/transferase [Dokdonella sp.]|uniref:LTA synthase family protein n=1 Tax=Dokdonella sp. TaxID=2291710 RepID=UPI003BAE5C60